MLKEFVMEEETVQTEEEIKVTTTPDPIEDSTVVETESVLSDIVLSEESRSVAASEPAMAEFCFVNEGQGASGFYTKETLRGMPHLFLGQPMHINHQRKNENGGVRNALHWVGDIKEAYYRENGALGAGVYGKATVFPQWQNFVKTVQLSEGGVSISGRAKIDEKGVVRQVNVIDSVDYVVRAGRGGKVIQVYEEALLPSQVLQEEEKVTMDVEKEGQVTEPVTEESKETPVTTQAEEEKAPVVQEAASSPVVDIKAVVSEAVEEAVKGIREEYESRLKLIESESDDRRIIKQVVEELGEDVSEEMRTHVEALIWQSRKPGVDIKEEAAKVLESFKPIFESFKTTMETKVAEAKKISEEKAANTPVIMSHINRAFTGDEESEVSEEDLRKQIAESLAGFIGAKNDDAATVIRESRGE